MMLDSLLAYSATMGKIPGWFCEADFRMFGHILDQQLRDGPRGGILEIGCYLGKSAIALGYGLRGDDTLVVCDLFEGMSTHDDIPDDIRSAYSGVQETRFRDNYAQYHDVPPMVLACESSQLREHLYGRRFRFTHIDGCHTYGCVKKDIALAAQHITPGGVIVLDDYRTSHSPGVGAASWEACAGGVLLPFCLTESKMYAATTRADQQRWLDAVMSYGFQTVSQPIFDLTVAQVRD